MKQFLTTVACCVLLFVVVCPITPTPIAVPGAKAQSVQIPVVAVAAMAVVLPFHSERQLLNTVSFEISGVTSVNIVDLTCARLC